MEGRRFFRPKFRTKSRNFPALESLMKQKICPRNVVGHFLRQKYVLNALMKLAPDKQTQSYLSAYLSLEQKLGTKLVKLRHCHFTPLSNIQTTIKALINAQAFIRTITFHREESG